MWCSSAISNNRPEGQADPAKAGKVDIGQTTQIQHRNRYDRIRRPPDSQTGLKALVSHGKGEYIAAKVFLKAVPGVL